MSFLLRLARKVPTLWRLPLREKLWLLLMYPYSGLVRIAVWGLPFRLLSRCLGIHYKNHELSPLVSGEQLLRARRIGWLCESVGRYTPWESKCLVQAIMAKTWLRYYEIPYVLYFGVRKVAGYSESMTAHAWVKVGPRVISGRQGHRNFVIVSSFVSPVVLGFGKYQD